MEDGKPNDEKGKKDSSNSSPRGLKLNKLPRMRSHAKASPRLNTTATQSDPGLLPPKSVERSRSSLLSRKTSKLMGRKSEPKSPRTEKKPSRSRSLRDLTERLSITHKMSPRRKKETPEPLVISSVVQTVHVQHVGQESANQFLHRLLKLRDEKYAHAHHEIRAGPCFGYIYLRPSTNMLNQFRAMLNSEALKNLNLQMDKSKYVRLWFELVPQAAAETQPNNGSWIFVTPGAVDTNPQQRWERLEYFPEHLENIKNASHKVEAVRFNSEDLIEDEELPRGPPDYALTFYVSKDSNSKDQMLGVIPLSDVKIVSLSATEISIGYVNKLANIHYLKFKSAEEANEWIRVLQLATQQEIRKIVRSAPVRSFHLLAGSVKDLKKLASGSTETSEISESEYKKSYLPVYWDEETLKEESFGLFSDALQLDEYYNNSGADCVQQGWRILGGSFEDIVLWCLITCNRPASENIDLIGLLITYPEAQILKVLEKHVDKAKKGMQKRGKEKHKKARQYFMRSDSFGEDDSSLEGNLQQKIFYMLEQWLKFLSRPVIDETENNTEVCEKLLKFAANRVRRDHLLILKGLNQQVQNQQLHLLPPPVRTTLLSIWEEESNICSVLDVGSTVLAEQLTLQEAKYHSCIHHSELLDLKWDKIPEQAPNLVALTDHFNIVALWVATQVLREETPRQQARLVAKFLRVAEKLFNLRNYSSCVQILSGLSNVAVQRLKRMQKHLDPKSLERFDRLGNYFDPVSGYSNYRKLSFEFPCLQLYAVAFRTLTLIEEGNPTFLDEQEQVICFSRITMVAECLEGLHLYEPGSTDYSFQGNILVEEWLLQMRPLTDEQLYELSIKHEPRRNQVIDEISTVTADKVFSQNPLFGKQLPNSCRPSGKLYSPEIEDENDADIRKSPRNKGRSIRRRSSKILTKLISSSSSEKRE